MTEICFYLTHYPMDKGYKFFFLAEKLRALGISVNIILCSTEVTGVHPGDFTLSEIKSMNKRNIWIMSRKQVFRHVIKNRYRYFAVCTFSSDIAHILRTARSKGAKIIEMAGIGFNDPVEHKADIYLQISKLSYKAAMNKRPGRAKKARKRIYVGSLFSDDIPDIYTSKLRSVDDFRKKYGVKGRVFIWMPGREDLVDYKFQKRLKNFVRPEDLMMVKPHPWSYKLQMPAVNKISKIMPVMAPRDSYWGLKAMTCAVGRNSTSGIELAIMKKPILYIGHMSRRPWLRKHVKAIGVIASTENDIKKMLRNRSFDHSDQEYSQFLDRAYPSPFRPAYERICEFFESCIKEQKS